MELVLHDIMPGLCLLCIILPNRIWRFQFVIYPHVLGLDKAGST